MNKFLQIRKESEVEICLGHSKQKYDQEIIVKTTTLMHGPLTASFKLNLSKTF